MTRLSRSISKEEIFTKHSLKGKDASLAFHAGILTGRLHNAGYVFTDNKAQNYLVVSDNLLCRTDLGFLQKKNSVFSRSIDIGSFLASVIDFEMLRYRSIEKAFFEGYMSGSKKVFHIFQLSYATYYHLVLHQINILCFKICLLILRNRWNADNDYQHILIFGKCNLKVQS